MSDPELTSIYPCASESSSVNEIEIVSTNIQNDKDREEVGISGCGSGTKAKVNYKQTSVQNFFKVPICATVSPTVLPTSTCLSAPPSPAEEQINTNSINITDPVSDSPDSTEPNKKKPYYRQKFADKWLAEERFKPWLEKRPSPSKNCFTAYCNFCCVQCTNGHSELVRHMATRIHLEKGNKRALELVEQQRNSLQRFVSGSAKQAELEGRLTLFIAENNLALSVIDSLGDLLKKCFPDDERVRKLALKKQKLGNVVRYGFGDYLKGDLVNTLKTVFFSVIIDETTDVSVKGQLACVVQYWSLNNHKLVVKLLDLIEVESASADGLSTSVLKLLEREDIPFDRVIGFSADTCSTMFGRNHSVSTLLTAALPNLLSIKCSCHSMNLSASYACKRLPVDIEDGLRGVFNHFSHSTARRRNFSAFQEFVGVAKHRILSPGQTRWLSLEACVWRVKDQLPALEEYFESEYKESNTQSNKAIIASLRHPLTVPFFLFVGHALNQMNEVNTQFQSESPQLHLLKGAIEGLMQSFATNFMNARYVISRVVGRIDVWLTSEYVSLRNVYLGEAANQWIQNSTALKSEDLDYLFKLCRSFYIEAFLQLRQRYDFTDSFFTISDLLHPKNARNCEPSNVTLLFQRFPILGKHISTSKAELEWRAHIHLEPEFFGCANDGSVRLLDAETYWSTVFKCTNPNGSMKFPNLSVCIAFLFSMPYSNVAAERVFSMLKLIKTDGRNSLHNLTLASLMRMKDWLKETEKSASTAEFSDQLINSVLSVVANRAIEPSIRSGLNETFQAPDPDSLPF